MSGTAGTSRFKWPKWQSAGSYLLKSFSGLSDCDVARRKILLSRLNRGRIVSFFVLRTRKSLILLMRTVNLLQEQKGSVDSSWEVRKISLRIKEKGYHLLFQF